MPHSFTYTPDAANKFLVSVLSIFMPIMRELNDMYYQFDRPYVFKSDKFEKKFDFWPTPYEEGIKEIVALDYQKS